MLSELQTAQKVVGVKQSRKAIRDGAAKCVVVAKEELGVPVEEADSMAELGKAAQIDIGAAVVAVLK